MNLLFIDCEIANKHNAQPKIAQFGYVLVNDSFQIIKEGYIDKLFKKLLVFFEDYREKFLGEDLEESKWNYDDFFKDVFKKVKNLNAYYGTYF